MEHLRKYEKINDSPRQLFFDKKKDNPTNTETYKRKQKENQKEQNKQTNKQTNKKLLKLYETIKNRIPTKLRW